MKKIFLFILTIVSISSFGQNPTNYQYRTVYERLRGLMPDSALHIPRYNGAPSGLRVGSSTQAGAIAMDTANHLVKYYSGSIWRDIQPIRDGLYSGGIVTWDSLLVFTVSAAVYYIGGQRYETDITHITLDAANGSNPRIDLIVATTSGIAKITGTAAASPAEANLPIDNIRLTAIFVNTSATTPTGPITKIIYDENTEFTGAATNVTTDFGNFTDPYHLVKATSAGAITNASFLTYTGTDFTIAPYNTFKFFVKLKATFAAGTRFQITWYKDGVQVSTTLNISSGTYGFLRTSGTYQEITIPVFDFGISTEMVDQVKFSLSGSNGSGFYLDYIQLKGGVSQPIGGLNRFGVSGEDAVATQARYFNAKNVYPIWMDSVASFALTATESRFKNIAGSNWLQYTASALIIDPLSTAIPLRINNIPYNSGSELVHLALDTLTNRLYRKTASGGGTDNANVGAGFRILKPSTQELKTLFNGYAVRIDSSSNTDGLTFKADTALLTSKLLLYKTIDSLKSLGTTEPWYKWYMDVGNPSNAFMWRNTANGGVISTAGSVFDNWMNSVDYSTGVSTNGHAYSHHGNNGIVQPIAISNSYRYNYGIKIRLEDLSDVTDTYRIYMGFADDHTTFSSIVDAICFFYTDADSSGQFVCMTKSNSTATTVASGITVAADTDYELEISVYNGSAAFFINKVLVATIVTNIPTGTARATSMNHVIKKSAGTNPRIMYIEWMAYGKRSN